MMKLNVVLTGVGCSLALIVALNALLDWQQAQSERTANNAHLVQAHQGDSSKSDGTPTVRLPFVAQADDPSTTNNEANDQPVGHFGTLTLSACSLRAGHCYTLDGELSGHELKRLYFP